MLTNSLQLENSICCKSLLYLAIVGNVAQKFIRAVRVVYAAAVVGESVAHDKIVDVQQHIVCGYLVEHALRDLHRRCLVFDYHPWLQLSVVQYAVGAQPLVTDAQGNLVGHERGRVALVACEPVYEVLPHPFLGR